MPMHIWLGRAAIAAAVVSMAFTGYFGWITAGDSTFAKVFNGFGGVIISFAVPAFFFLAAVAAEKRAASAWWTFIVLGGIFAFADAASNTGALFAMREGSKLEARHATTVSHDIRDKVERLRTRIKTLETETSFQSEVETSDGRKFWFAAPTGYNQLIKAYELKLYNEEHKRGGCGLKCEGFKTDVANLIAAKENAIIRVGKLNDLSQRRAELREAETQAAETPGKVSPIDVITAKIGSIAQWDLNPGENTKAFVYLLITMFLGTVLTVLSAGLSYGSKWLQSESGFDPSPQKARNTWLTDETKPHAYAQVLDVHPSQPQPRPSQSVVVVSDDQKSNWNQSQLKELLDRARRLQAEIA